MGLLITSKYRVFSNFLYGLSFSQSTPDVLTVASDRIAETSTSASGYHTVAQRYPRLST